MQTTSIVIEGYLVGPIWSPQTEAYKPVKYVASDSPFADGELSEPLRDHVLRMTCDGDFQSCDLADGWVTITREQMTGHNKHVRSFPLDRFPSVADMLRYDWTGPDFDGE